MKKFLPLMVTLGWFFYVFNPSGPCLIAKGGFLYKSDCLAAQTAAASAIPTPTTGAVTLMVVPGCWQDQAGTANPIQP